MTPAAGVAVTLAAAGLVVLVLLYARRRRVGRRPTWIVTILAGAAGAGLCYVPHPRVVDVQVFGIPFPVAFNVFTTKLTALQPLGVFAVASWVLNALLVRELLLVATARRGESTGHRAASVSADTDGDGQELPTPSTGGASPTRRRRAR